MHAVQKANEEVCALVPKALAAAPAAATLATGFGISASVYHRAGHALQLVVLTTYHRQLAVLGN